MGRQGEKGLRGGGGGGRMGVWKIGRVSSQDAAEKQGKNCMGVCPSTLRNGGYDVVAS